MNVLDRKGVLKEAEVLDGIKGLQAKRPTVTYGKCVNRQDRVRIG
jgi:hypothetical protein